MQRTENTPDITPLKFSNLAANTADAHKKTQKIRCVKKGAYGAGRIVSLRNAPPHLPILIFCKNKSVYSLSIDIVKLNNEYPYTTIVATTAEHIQVRSFAVKICL